jgi:formylglycine-generating enzyme required for sulfatase activity
MGTARGLRGTAPICALMCVFTLIAAAAGVASCQALVGIPDVSLEEDGGTGSGDATTGGGEDSGDGGSSLDSGACGPTADRRSGGPSMVEVAVPRLGTSYCIDTTEVTVSQFNAYLEDTNGVYTDVPAVCSSVSAPPAAPPEQDHVTDHANLPVGHVGSCDAFSFCRWAGKRLCGALGDGGSLAYGQTSEWSYACANGETNYLYPYGSDYEAGVCNLGSDAAVPVGSMAGCHGVASPFDRIFDMVGNEWELVNDLEVNEGNIGALGGSYATTVDEIPSTGACTYATGFNGVIFDDQPSGFRCCADPDSP